MTPFRSCTYDVKLVYYKEYFIMPRWTYKLVVNNQTDRPLKLVSSNIPYGRPEGMLPDQVFPSCSATYEIYSPAGVPSGIEFYLTFQDVAPVGLPSYGTMNVSVDIPFWKHANKSSCETTDLLVATGFQKVPNGNHDFQTIVTVSTAL